MKAISLLQPWAQLVVIGAKQIETRSWNTKYRGELLIHASANKRQAINFAQDQPFDNYIKHWSDLPFGAIVGKVNLIATAPTNHFLSIMRDHIRSGWAAQINVEEELSFGDFSLNRYGWLLQNPVKFEKPIPYKGALSIWEFPDELLNNVK